MEYNTAQEPLIISEYGRTVQRLVQHIKETEDREKRTRMAHTVVAVMLNVNPAIRELDNYEQTLWDHLYIIADYDLDVDAPYPIPDRTVVDRRPEPIPYKEELISFRFYGRNLQNIIEQAAEMEESEMKTALINYIASFMVNSSRNWNDENLDNETVAQHLRTLSKGKLDITADDLEIHIEHRGPKRKPNMGNKKKKKINKKR